MTSYSAPSVIYPAPWRCTDGDWHLIVADKCNARIERDGRRWLCFAVDDDDNDIFLGQCRSLASGKAHLLLRYALLPSEKSVAHEAATL